MPNYLRIDYKTLEQVLEEEDTWYRFMAPVMRAITAMKDVYSDDYEIFKEELYDFVEERLDAGKIRLGDSAVNWDREHTGVDTAVIHHTSNTPWISLSRLSAIGLIRVYADAYANPGSKEDEIAMAGRAISSGHIYDGKQVFWTYHWLIRSEGGLAPNGSAISMLSSKQIGWHAGNWPINCRSIAIALDGDYVNARPSDQTLVTIANTINRYGIKKERVFGHCETSKKPSVSPSRLFLSEDRRRGWKEDLLELVRE